MYELLKMKKIKNNKHTPATSAIRPITKGTNFLSMVSVFPERTIIRPQCRRLSQKSNMEQEEYPVEHLNHVRARMYRALCLGVLKIFSIDNTHLKAQKEDDNTHNMTSSTVAVLERNKSNSVQQSKSVKINNNSPISFRFIRKVRKRSCFDERDCPSEGANKLREELIAEKNKIVDKNEDERQESKLKKPNTELNTENELETRQNAKLRCTNVNHDNEVTFETDNSVQTLELENTGTESVKFKLDQSAVYEALQCCAEKVMENINFGKTENGTTKKAKGQFKNSNTRRASVDIAQLSKITALHIENTSPLINANKVPRRWSDPEAIIKKRNSILLTNNKMKNLNLGGTEKLLEVGCQIRGNNTQLYADKKKLNKIILELHCKQTAHATPLAKANERVVADIDIINNNNNNNKTTQSDNTSYNKKATTLLLHTVAITEPLSGAHAKHDNDMKIETNLRSEEVINMKEDTKNNCSDNMLVCVPEDSAMGISSEFKKKELLIGVETAIATEKAIDVKREEPKVTDHEQVSKQINSQEQCQSFVNNEKTTKTPYILSEGTASESISCNSFEKSTEHLTTEISSTTSNIAMPEFQTVPARVLLSAKVDSDAPEEPPFNEIVNDDNAKKKVRLRKNSFDKIKSNATTQTKNLLPFTASTTTVVAQFEDIAKCDIKSRPSFNKKKKVIIKRQQGRLSDSDAGFFGQPISEEGQQAGFFGEQISKKGDQQANETEIGIEMLEKEIARETSVENDCVELNNNLEIEESVEKEEQLVEEQLLKSCLKPREFMPDDLVMYAERYKRTMVRWKKGRVIERITSNSYKLDIDGKEVAAHISYIKKHTDLKVNFGGKEYLEINYEQIEEEEEDH